MPRLQVPEPREEPPLSPPARVLPQKRRSGAWKVAYADFVTALMALFIVLWMMSASTRVKESVQGYFRDPRAYTRKLGAGPAAQGEGLRVDQRNIQSLREHIAEALRQMPEFKQIQKNVLMSVTGEGLRIDLMENEKGMFFVTGNPTPTPEGERLVRVLAAELSKMPNQIVIEGHTDAQPFRDSSPSSLYSNWELATDRAHAARRLLYKYGMSAPQVGEIRGFADHHLLNTENPNDPRNRRISVVVMFLDAPG